MNARIFLPLLRKLFNAILNSSAPAAPMLELSVFKYIMLILGSVAAISMACKVSHKVTVLVLLLPLMVDIISVSLLCSMISSWDMSIVRTRPFDVGLAYAFPVVMVIIANNAAVMIFLILIIIVNFLSSWFVL